MALVTYPRGKKPMMANAYVPPAPSEDFLEALFKTQDVYPSKNSKR